MNITDHKILFDQLFQKKDFDRYRCLKITLTMRIKEKLDEDKFLKNFRFFMNRLQQKTVRLRKNQEHLRIKTFPILEKEMNQRYNYHILLEIPDKYLDRRDEFIERIKESLINTEFKFWEMNVFPLYNENCVI